MIQLISAQNALSLNLLPADTSSSSSSGNAYAEAYGVIVGSDGIEYTHVSQPAGWMTWRSDLGHSFTTAAPADVLAIWQSQQTPVASPTSPPSTPPVITTPPAASTPSATVSSSPAVSTIGQLNIDRKATSGSIGTGITPASGSPLVNTLPASGGQLAPAAPPATINWRMVLFASLALGAVLWFFGSRRRRKDS
jgi:hypothetical protein